MGETEEPGQPADNPSDPARLPDRVDHQHDPARWDAEQHRRFQEYQEFQQFQQYLRSTGQQPGPGQPESQGLAVPPGQPGPPPAPGQPPTHDVGTQIAGLRQQLVQLTETQIRIDRAVNPPWWRRLLRGRLIRWLAGLLVIIILAIWGVPALINHYFGSPGSGSSAGATNPGTPAEQRAYFTGARQAVQAVYDDIGGLNDAGQACAAFSPDAVRAFALAAGAPTCTQAIANLSRQVTAPVLTYRDNADLAVRSLPGSVNNQSPFTVYACSVPVAGGPTLGVFTLTLMSPGQWEITGYAMPTSCPAPTSAATPTS